MANPNSPAFATPCYIAPAPGLQLRNMTDEAGHLVKTGAGIIYGLNVNAAQASGTAEIIDGIDGTGTVLGTISLATVGLVSIGWPFAVGLFIITQGTGTANVTATYT